MRVAQLHEARGLVGGGRVDGAAQVQRVVGDQAHRAPFDARQRGVDADAEARAQQEQAALVRQPSHRRAGVVHAQAVFGHHLAQGALVGRDPVSEAALEERQVVARGRHRLRFIVGQDVDHAIGVLHAARADVLGPEHAQAAAFDHGRPAHAEVAGARGDDDVAATHQRGVAGKAAPVHDADHRHLARELRIGREGVHVQAGDDGGVGVARPAAAAFGKQHDWPLLIERDAQHAVGLGVVAHALRAGQHGGVVGHHHGARGLGPEDGAVDAADARHHAVGGRVGDQVFQRAPARLRGNGQRAVFDEAALVAQILDVLARAAAALRVALGHGLRSGRVQRVGVALGHALQVGADVVKVVCGGVFGPRVRLAFDGFEHQQRLALRQIAAGHGQQARHAAGVRRGDDVLHLHRFEHGDLGAGRHLVAHGHAQLHQARGHGCEDGVGRGIGGRL